MNVSEINGSRSSSNATSADLSEVEEKLKSRMKVFFVCVYAILAVGTIFGNVLVVRAFCKFSTLRRVTSNFILVSLSIADTFEVVVFTLHITTMLGPKLPPHLLCSVTSMLSLTFNSVIILHLALISLDRLIAVKYALRYPTMVTNRRALIASIAVWFWGIGVSMIFPEPLKTYGKRTFTEFLRTLTPCFDLHEKEPFTLRSNAIKAYLIFLTISLLVVPITVVIVSYCYILNVARKQQNQINKVEDSLQVSKLAMKREMKAARTVGIVVGLCLASFVPLLVVLSLRALTSTTITAEHMYGTQLAASLNAFWNPLIYCWRNGNFRSSFKRLLKCSHSE